MDSAAVAAKGCARPEHLALFKALAGDPGDTVPGVEGIGPKKAKALAPLLAEHDPSLASLPAPVSPAKGDKAAAAAQRGLSMLSTPEALAAAR